MQSPGGQPSTSLALLPEEPSFLLSLFGIGLPLLAIVVELAGRVCAGHLFDPFPTVGHIFVVATVPVANWLALRALRRRDGVRLQGIIFLEALAVAVAAVYTLIFLPVMPIGIVGLLAFGLGILPLTPAFALWSSIRTLFRLCRLRDALAHPPRQTVLAGLAAGFAVLLALQVPTATTRVLMAMAASERPSLSGTGLAGLRRLGQRELMLRACYQGPGVSPDLLSAVVNTIVPVPPEKVREIYYRVTGRPFDTEPRPRLVGRSDDREENEWDVIQGGTEVGVVPLRGLSLASSRLDGSIDGRAAVAYLEWTFELRNEAPQQREARAEVALPPGGVVSRVTLWVDGEEREAAFAGRGAARRAYQAVVRQRRDPILVTTTAPDRILVQCFPVPPNGGLMKARIGITAPLHLANAGAGTLGLPYLTQRNFDVPVGHAVWISSKDPFLAPAPPLVRELGTGQEEIRGTLPEPRRAGPLGALTVRRSEQVMAAWTGDRLSDQPGWVRQTLQIEPIPAPPGLVVVIDGSAAMEDAVAQVEAGLRAVPKGLATTVIIAADRPRGVSGAISDVRFEGGADSAPALLQAWERAAAVPGTAVLWIHGPQAMLLGPVEELRQRLERRSGGPVIHSYAAAAGENLLLARLADVRALRAVPRLQPGPGDLSAFLASLDGSGRRVEAVRVRLFDEAPPRSEQTSDHLARLWAHDRILTLARGHMRERDEAIKLAGAYHLVTPVSGAVVLESDAQYQAAGLKPGDSSNVPTVPEPGTWAVIAVVALVLLLALFGRRRFPALGRYAA